MLFESTNPQNSQAQFKSRSIINLACVFGLFAASVFLMSWILWLLSQGFIAMLICDAVALAGAYFLFTLWQHRPIKIECTGCHKIISSSTPWVCKACGAKNMDTVNFPFVNKCETCGVSPKAYKCHHEDCDEMIYFTEDEDSTNYAHCLNSTKEIPEKGARDSKLEKMRDAKAEAQERHEIAMIKEETAKIRQRVKPEKKKSRKEAVLERFESDVEMDELENELKARFATKYKNDKAKLKRLNALIEKNFRRLIVE